MDKNNPTAKEVFKAVKQLLGSGKEFHSADGRLRIFKVPYTKEEEYRFIFLGDNCEVSQKAEDKECETKFGEHLSISGTFYTFKCYSTTFGGVPRISMREAMEILAEQTVISTEN